MADPATAQSRARFAFIFGMHVKANDTSIDESATETATTTARIGTISPVTAATSKAGGGGEICCQIKASIGERLTIHSPFQHDVL